MKLTDEQINIVHHHQGAAIVYAVAGAGKSTTMAHRVQHLVQEKNIRPERILVCSFSRETVADIRRKIEGLDVTGVQCQTFNALGRKIVQKAISYGHWPAFDESQIEHRSSMLAMRALVDMSRRHGKNFAALDVNQEDLQTFVSVCKGNLRYADVATARLPLDALRDVSQAEHSNKHYLHAYQIYEQLRQQNNWLTFDDQLLLGWEALVRFEDIRSWAKSTFDYLLIDEFQDVNKVQAQIADILTEDHRNYMAIGDDDQCIYEWRGADVRFILDFKKRYNATEFVISDNFRCYGEATFLASQVIARNKLRHAKDLVAQKGFGGQVVLKGFDHDGVIAGYLVKEYQTLLANGMTPKDVVVLVRSYSQTPIIEARLIQDGLPYQVVGSQRFYERPEVKVLFTYLSFARQERDYMAQGGKGELSEQYVRRFTEIIRQPNRYLTNEWIGQLIYRGQAQQRSLVGLLEDSQLNAANDNAQKRLQKLAQTLRRLQQRLEQPIADTLTWLISDLEYLEALKNSAGIPELGEERCNNVRALVNYAQKKGDALQFLEHLRRLHLEDAATDNKIPRLQIMSIHRSKGLEWPVVFVPCCADEQLPSINNDNLEEERRLLYVAMTRSKQSLHLLYAPQNKLSIFLREVGAENILTNAEKIKNTLNKNENTLNEDDAINLALGVKMYPLARYLQLWWQPHQSVKAALKQKGLLALNKQQDAQQQLADFKVQIANAAPQQNQQEALAKQFKSLERKIQLFRARPITILLDTAAPEHGFNQQSFSFQQLSTEKIVALNQQGKRVGTIDIKASRFPLTEVHDWSWLKGQLSIGFRFSFLRRTMNLTLAMADNISLPALQKAQQPPSPPAMVQYLASDDFNEDIQRLVKIL